VYGRIFGKAMKDLLRKVLSTHAKRSEPFASFTCDLVEE
jgi:hypothetical protein